MSVTPPRLNRANTVRWTGMVGLALSLGLVTSIIVAWWCSLTAPTRLGRTYSSVLRGMAEDELAVDPLILVTIHQSTDGSDGFSVDFYGPDINFITPHGRDVYVADLDARLPRTLPLDAFMEGSDRRPNPDTPTIDLPLPRWARSLEYRFARGEWHFAAGRPFRCLRGKRGGADGDQGVISLRYSKTLPPVHFPTIFIWPGMLANTAVYGSVWLAIILALRSVFSIERRRRAKHGLCTACGYDLGGAPGCPECGRGMPPPGTPTAQ